MKLTSKEEFYRDTQRFFDAGLLKEVYSDDIKCICNACNSHYICFPYLKVDDLNSQMGLVCTEKAIKPMLSDANLIVKLLTNNDQKFIDTWCCYANDQLFNELLEIKKKTDIEGPSKFVDLELEDEIMQKGKTR